MLVLNPVDPDSPEAAAGKTHVPELFVAPRANHYTQDFFMNAHYGEYWVGPRAGLQEMTAMTGIETNDIAQLADALSKDVGSEAGAVRVRVIREADPQITEMVEDIREANGFADPDGNTHADDKLHEFAAEARMCKDEYEIREMRKAVAATKHGFDNILRKIPSSLIRPISRARSRPTGSSLISRKSCIRRFWTLSRLVLKLPSRVPRIPTFIMRACV